MNMQTAHTILFNNGFIIRTNENLMVVERPFTNNYKRATVAEVSNLLRPFDPNFITFYQAYERVQIFFD